MKDKEYDTLNILSGLIESDSKLLSTVRVSLLLNCLMAVALIAVVCA